jgi:hypothetical protein
MSPKLAYSCLALALCAGCSAAASAPLTLLPEGTLGRCLDGSPSGYYFLPGTDATKWTITLFGGGECSDAPSCTSKLQSPLGSSKYFSPTQAFDAGAHFADADPATNPGFAAWNHVQLPYCSQDLHMGTRTATSADTFGLYFSGHHVLNATLAALEAAHGLGAATDVLLTGDSAGGIGVWPHLDWLAARYPRARVVGAPVAGFYFYSFPYLGPNHTHSVLASFSPEGVEALHGLYQPFLNARCQAAYQGAGASPAPCMLSNYSRPFVAAPVFVVEAQTDQVQLLDHDDVPAESYREAPEMAYIAQWALNMSIALQVPLDPSNAKDGAFSPCVSGRAGAVARWGLVGTARVARALLHYSLLTLSSPTPHPPCPSHLASVHWQGLLYPHQLLPKLAHHQWRGLFACRRGLVHWGHAQHKVQAH